MTLRVNLNSMSSIHNTTKREQYQAQEEKNVLEAIASTGGYFTVYWATETQYRAAALGRLETRGVIRTERLRFPLLRASVQEGLLPALAS